jgi:hypothetical protein
MAVSPYFFEEKPQKLPAGDHQYGAYAPEDNQEGEINHSNCGKRREYEKADRGCRCRFPIRDELFLASRKSFRFIESEQQENDMPAQKNRCENDAIGKFYSYGQEFSYRSCVAGTCCKDRRQSVGDHQQQKIAKLEASHKDTTIENIHGQITFRIALIC